MPELPTISGKELVKILQQKGFVVQRQSGSHVILEHTDGRIVVVPVHNNRELPKGTLKAILRDAEVSL